jgi:hypothetical protein
MGVPPHLPLDRAAADRLWAAAVANGSRGPAPVSVTQADVHEKNRRPIVRFERNLPLPSTGGMVEAGSDGGMEKGKGWKPYSWRARLCRGYEEEEEAGEEMEVAGSDDESPSQQPRTRGEGGAPPNRIGRVYTLGSFAGLWAGTMQVRSRPVLLFLDPLTTRP